MSTTLEDLAILGSGRAFLLSEFCKLVSRRMFVAQQALRRNPEAARLPSSDTFLAVSSAYWMLPASQQARLCREPLFSYAAHQTMHFAAADPTSAWMREYANLLGALMIEAGLRGDIEIREAIPARVATLGMLELPNYPGFRGVPEAVEGTPVLVRTDGARVLVTDVNVGESQRFAPGAFTGGTELQGGLRLEGGPWYRRIGGVVIERAIEEEGEAGAGGSVSSAFLDAADPAVLSHFRDALRLLEKCSPVAFAEVQDHVTVVVPIRTPYATGFTIDNLRGAVFVTPEAHVIDTIDHLVHEAAHNKLHTIEEVHPVLEPTDGQVYVSPWRTDLRPMSGIVHGAYVFTLVGFALTQLAGELSALAPAINRRVAVYRDQVTQALATIDENAKLTPAGEEFLCFLRRWHADLAN